MICYGGDGPLWVNLLLAAGRDPLRAQEMEQHLSIKWFERWKVAEPLFVRAEAEAIKAASRSSTPYDSDDE